MKKTFLSILATAALAVPALASREIEWLFNSGAGVFDEQLWTGLKAETHEIVFLTGDDLRIVDGYVMGALDLGGTAQLDYVSDPDEDEEDAIAGTWTDDGDNNFDALYVVGVRDIESQEVRALATDDGNVLLFTWKAPINLKLPTDNLMDQGDIGDISASTWTGNPWTGEEGGGEPDPLPQPSVSAFSVTGQTAALVVSGAQSGAWYTVWRAGTLGGEKEFVESRQASGETVSFEVSAAGNAGFFYVTGDRAEQTSADSWR